jgi:hypothetical protein
MLFLFLTNFNACSKTAWNKARAAAENATLGPPAWIELDVLRLGATIYTRTCG